MAPANVAAIAAACMIQSAFTQNLPWVSILGDPGMQADSPSIAWTGWTFCNYARGPDSYGQSPSPRMADCVATNGPGPNGNAITDADEALDPSLPFPDPSFPTPGPAAVDQYAIIKEQYLASRCFKPSPQGGDRKWSHWSNMFKSGNMNVTAGLCPRTNSTTTRALSPPSLPLRFNNLPMNQPLMVHGWSTPGQPGPYNSTGWAGYYAGTYDWQANWTGSEKAAVQAALVAWTEAWIAYRLAEIEAESQGVAPPSPPPAPALLANSSYLFTAWFRNSTSNSWAYHMGQRTSPSYPWLMNYIRSNEVGPSGYGPYGGYPWPGGGVMIDPMTTVGSRLLVQFNVLNPGPSTHHFYMPCFGGCWKLDGSPCDGDLNSDATRYVCFQFNLGGSPCGNAKSNNGCPLIHYKLDGTAVYRNDSANYPYNCYTQVCPPWGCDPYSNPNPQELMMLQPCEEWAAHGFPAAAGQGWTNATGGNLWDLDVGGLGARLHLFGTDPPVTPAVQARMAAVEALTGKTLPATWPGWGRTWLDFEIGPEMFAPSAWTAPMLRWQVSQWDVQVLSV